MTLRTVAQLVQSPPAEPRLGERLWKPTSQVVFPFPISWRRGRFRREEIYFMRGETCVVRPYRVPHDPKTPVQMARRIAMGEAKSNWCRVSAEDREAWKVFGLEHVLTAEERSWRVAALVGFNTYVRAQIYRQGMGAGLSLDAPRFGVPGAVAGLEEVAPPDAESFAFRLEHGLGLAEEERAAGYRVLFEITPALPTLKRKPRNKEFRWAGVVDAESFLPLGPDGAVYLLPRARFAVEAGRAYGVRARIVSPDGLPGKALMVKMIRLAPEPDAWTVEAAAGTDAQAGHAGAQAQGQALQSRSETRRHGERSGAAEFSVGGGGVRAERYGKPGTSERFTPLPCSP